MCTVHFHAQQPLPPVLASSVLHSVATESLRTALCRLKTKGSPKRPSSKCRWVSAPRPHMYDWKGILANVWSVHGELWKLLRAEEKESQVKRPPIGSLQWLANLGWSLYDGSRGLGKHRLWNGNKWPMNTQVGGLPEHCGRRCHLRWQLLFLAALVLILLTITALYEKDGWESIRPFYGMSSILSFKLTWFEEILRTNWCSSPNIITPGFAVWLE